MSSKIVPNFDLEIVGVAGLTIYGLGFIMLLPLLLEDL